jgi:predicted RNA-binding Zn ribbon-like protein
LAEYPSNWIERRDGQPASDLDLVVLLLNSLDLLDDPPDRLTDLTWFREVLADVGHDAIGAALREPDLAELRELRDALRMVFTAPSAGHAAAILNPLLARGPAIPQLVVSGHGVALRVNPHDLGLRALAARLPAALAEHIAERGIGRLGTCAAPPCQCAYVDHTRAQIRRYCCTLCNDRAAARSYRQRRKSDAGHG